MPDFKEFINICQNQLLPLLSIKSPSELVNFNQKIKEFAISINYLYPKQWKEWKNDKNILEVLEMIKNKAYDLLSTIDGYEIDHEQSQILIYLDKEIKRFPLLDPIHFIQTNLYEHSNIYFYILLGEMLDDENFAIFQLYGSYLKVHAQEPLA